MAAHTLHAEPVVSNVNKIKENEDHQVPVMKH